MHREIKIALVKNVKCIEIKDQMGRTHIAA